jgi:hypothetical protein
MARCEAVDRRGRRICAKRAVYYVDGTFAACVNHFDGAKRGLRFRQRPRAGNRAKAVRART